MLTKEIFEKLHCGYTNTPNFGYFSATSLLYISISSINCPLSPP